MIWVSIETRVVLDRVVWTSTWAVWISACVSTETKATLLGGGEALLWRSVCSVGSPRYGGKVGGQEGTESFTTKSIALGQKSGIFRREKKGNTYAASAQSPCFLQNRSNCKTVLYLRDPPTDHRSLSSSGYCDHSLSHRKTKCVFFKLWGSNLSQFFSIQFKGVRLELLVPMCKRENKLPAPSFYWRRPSLLLMGV